MGHILHVHALHGRAHRDHLLCVHHHDRDHRDHLLCVRHHDRDHRDRLLFYHDHRDRLLCGRDHQIAEKTYIAAEHYLKLC